MKPSLVMTTSVAVLGVGVLLAGYGLASRQSTAGVSAESGDQAQIRLRQASDIDASQLENEVDALKAQVFALRAQVAANARPEANAGDDAATEPPTPKARAQQMAEDDRKYQEYITGVEANFQLEPVDPKWKETMASTVWDTIQGDPVIRNAARTVDCRSKTCRVEIADDGDGEFNKRIPELATQFSGTLPNIAANRIEDASGAHMVLYLTGPREPEALAVN